MIPVANTARTTYITNLATDAVANLQASQTRHLSDIDAYYDAQKALLQDQIDALTRAATYAADDLGDGFTTLTDAVNDYRDDKIAAFNTQNDLVVSYYTRALTDEKNILDLLENMNVHYISGITATDDGAGGFTIADNGADLSVYDDCFDNFQYDVGHL